MAEKRTTTDEAAAAPEARAEEPVPAPATEPVTSPASSESTAPGQASTSAPRKRSTPSKRSASRTAPVVGEEASAEAAKPAKASRTTKSTTRKPGKAAKTTEPSPASATGAAATGRSPAKKAAAKKAAKPAVPAPRREPSAVAPISPAPVSAPSAPVAASIPGAWMAAAWQAVQDPNQPPRRLAELAVSELGPRAAAWAGWLRTTYPDAPPHGLARLAAHQAGRFGWPLALTGVGGPVAAAMSLPVVAWVRASVVLRVAAAYGYDPTDSARVGDLLELLGLVEPAGSTKPSMGRLTGLAGRIGLTRIAITRLGLRRTPAAKAVRVLTAAADHHESIERLAHRAARRYRPKSAPL